MSRYIDANELIDDLLSYAEANKGTYHEEGFKNAITVVEDQPTADARENVHAHWIKHENRECWFCSNCNTDDYYAYYWDCNTAERELQDLFCPNCGAQMDERSDNDTN